MIFLKARNRLNQEQTEQLRADINSSLRDLELSEPISERTIANVFPSRISRSLSADQERHYRSAPKVSFKDDPLIDR